MFRQAQHERREIYSYNIEWLVKHSPADSPKSLPHRMMVESVIPHCDGVRLSGFSPRFSEGLLVSINLLVLFYYLLYPVSMGWLQTIPRELISLELFLPLIPLFVAFDPLGILPIFVSLTSDMGALERKRVIRQSILTGLLVSIGFLAVGKWVFELLGISVSDFKVAGGILLFIIAVVDLIFPEKTRSFPKETLGVVPIGIPLIVGPGVLTLLLISARAYGDVSTIICLILNLLIVWFVFSHSHRIIRFLKEGGTKGIGKVFALLLAAFAMMMIRTGIMDWVSLMSH